MELLLGYAALREAVGEVGSAVDVLDEACRRSAADVERLLDGGWRGAAADAFAEAWSEWLTGAGEVRAALASIGDAIADSHRLAAAADTVTTSELAGLHERVVR
jgi:WXG100 family type VII secretion target